MTTSANHHSGLLIVLSGPSGVGKTTISHLLTSKHGLVDTISAVR